LLFCRVIEKREEHQRNVQIYTIPETVPTHLINTSTIPSLVGSNYIFNK